MIDDVIKVVIKDMQKNGLLSPKWKWMDTCNF